VARDELTQAARPPPEFVHCWGDTLVERSGAQGRAGGGEYRGERAIPCDSAAVMRRRSPTSAGRRRCPVRSSPTHSGAPRVIGGDSGRAISLSRYLAILPVAGLLQGGSARGSRVRPATSGSEVRAPVIARPRKARATGIAMPARAARTARFDQAGVSPSPVSAAVSAGTACAVEGMLTPRVPHRCAARATLAPGDK